MEYHHAAYPVLPVSLLRHVIGAGIHRNNGSGVGYAGIYHASMGLNRAVRFRYFYQWVVFYASDIAPCGAVLDWAPLGAYHAL